MGLYLALVRAQVSAQWQYRGSFVVQAVGQFLATFTDFIMLLLLFQQFPSIAGWTLGEVAFLYGMGGLAFGISDLLCGGFDGLSKMIRLGTFDRVLTRQSARSRRCSPATSRSGAWGRSSGSSRSGWP